MSALARLTRRKAELDLDAVEDNLIWIVCSPRSGSTWLMNMLGEHPRVVRIDEPHIGLHLGIWAEDALSAPVEGASADRLLFHELRAKEGDYFFAEMFREAWAPHLRAMMLARFGAHAQRWGDVPDNQQPIVCVKEPNGAQGAGLALSVLPRARMIHLVRDPRDVVVSHLDAYRPGTWLGESFPGADFGDAGREERVREFALRWTVRAQVGTQAFDRHDPQRRMLIRYEDLRAEPGAWFRRTTDWLGFDAKDNDAIVERMSFERLPAEGRGDGRFARKAQPGEWREALSPAEQAIVVELCGEQMLRLGYEI